MSTPTRQPVPWEIDAYSPQMHAQVAMALNSEQSLNEAMANRWDPQTQQNREDLHDALQCMANGFTPYLPGGSRHQPLVADAVYEARNALRRGDLDAALDRLSSAAEQREAVRCAEPYDDAIDRVLDELSGRLRTNSGGADHAAPVNSGRGPAMSAMTAANRVRDAVAEAEQDGCPLSLNDGDIQAFERVQPERADDIAAHDWKHRRDWQHRRPERAPRQPTNDVPSHLR